MGLQVIAASAVVITPQAGAETLTWGLFFMILVYSNLLAVFKS
jgi:hypothetical protein